MVKYQQLRHCLVKSVRTLTQLPKEVLCGGQRIDIECMSKGALQLWNFLQLIQSKKKQYDIFRQRILETISLHHFRGLILWSSSSEEQFGKVQQSGKIGSPKGAKSISLQNLQIVYSINTGFQTTNVISLKAELGRANQNPRSQTSISWLLHTTDTHIDFRSQRD